jgi:copper chaperone CopZ
MMRLLKEAVTVTEKLAEVSGVAQTRVSVHAGAYVQVSLGQRLNSDGAASANAGLVIIAPDGFGDTWSVKAGDTVTVRGVQMLVAASNEQRQPQTGVLHHVEVQIV